MYVLCGLGAWSTAAMTTPLTDANRIDVEFEAGGAVQEAYGLDADMTGYDVNLRVDVVGSVVVVGTQLNKTELSRRHKDVFVNRVTIKANVACAMLR